MIMADCQLADELLAQVNQMRRRHWVAWAYRLVLMRMVPGQSPPVPRRVIRGALAGLHASAVVLAPLQWANYCAQILAHYREGVLKWEPQGRNALPVRERQGTA